MTDEKPDYLPARVGEYRPQGCKDVRVTAGNCVLDVDIYMLAGAQPVQRDVYVFWGDTIKTKTFTRLRIGRKDYLADRVTGTLYNEDTGMSSTSGLRLV
jgi:hypothetical protein